MVLLQWPERASTRCPGTLLKPLQPTSSTGLAPADRHVDADRFALDAAPGDPPATEARAPSQSFWVAYRFCYIGAFIITILGFLIIIIV